MHGQFSLIRVTEQLQKNNIRTEFRNHFVYLAVREIPTMRTSKFSQIDMRTVYAGHTLIVLYSIA